MLEQARELAERQAEGDKEFNHIAEQLKETEQELAESSEPLREALRTLAELEERLSRPIRIERRREKRPGRRPRSKSRESSPPICALAGMPRQREQWHSLIRLNWPRHWNKLHVTWSRDAFASLPARRLKWSRFSSG